MSVVLKIRSIISTVVYPLENLRLCLCYITSKLCYENNKVLFIMNIITPTNSILTPLYKKSLAYFTIYKRMPAILNQTSDNLKNHQQGTLERHGATCKEIAVALSNLERLREEILADKPLRPLRSGTSDVPFYNYCIHQETKDEVKPTYLTTKFLLSECYIFRRIQEVFENTVTLTAYDPFQILKQQQFLASVEHLTKLADHVLSLDNVNNKERLKEEFIKLLKINLWGNKLDLSLSFGKIAKHQLDPMHDVSKLEKNLLCDHSEDAWKNVTESSASSQLVDIVLDNVGYEIFSDLCLADLLITKNLAPQVRLYVKTIPWYVSDATTTDLNWMIDYMTHKNNKVLNRIGQRWRKYFRDRKFVIVEDEFWTLPIDYSIMHKIKPSLYNKLAQSKLVIVKGDLNGRRLFGDKKWEPTVSVGEALQRFCPSRILSVRTLKSEIVCGLADSVAEEMDKTDADWMGSGNYGLIQYSGCVNRLSKD